jgi:surfeit locus 1 family protein
MNPEARSLLNEPAHGDKPRQRSTATLIMAAGIAALFFAVFTALGTWQVQRLFWKLDLIERVEQRAFSAPVPIPDHARWPGITAASDEYRHVRVEGRYLYDLTAKVLAATELGSGYWLMTPLQLADDNVVLINRGFVSPTGEDLARQAGSAAKFVTVTGLLRMSEPDGGFLRDNDLGNDRWYSRDVQAIASSRGLPEVAPFFVDADAKTAGTAKEPGAYPVGGLTVLHFNNNHLVYAVTWYALALMMAGAAWWVIRGELRLRRELMD